MLDENMTSTEDKSLLYWTPRFLKYMAVERRRSENTLLAYSNDLKQFMHFLQTRFRTSDPQLHFFTKESVRGFLAHLVKSKASAQSSSRKLSTLRAFAKYLEREQVIQTNPTLNIVAPKQHKILPQFLTRAEVKTLLSIPKVESCEGLRDFLILSLFYATGMRVSELAMLKLSNILITERLFRITGKGNKERLLPMGDRIAQTLQDYLHRCELEYGRKKVKNDYVFEKNIGEPFSRQQIATIVRSYISKVSG